MTGLSGSDDPTQLRVNELVAALRSEVDKIEQLGAALSSRDAIGQAKGMLMERFTIDAAAAFGILHEASNRSNVKLHDVAHQLVRDRTIDGYPNPS